MILCEYQPAPAKKMTLQEEDVGNKGEEGHSNKDLVQQISNNETNFGLFCNGYVAFASYKHGFVALLL
jgi:hypothetical protein